MFNTVEKNALKEVEEAQTIASHVVLSRKAPQMAAKTQMPGPGSALRMRVV